MNIMELNMLAKVVAKVMAVWNGFGWQQQGSAKWGFAMRG
jgi:hypothetical protein